MAQLRQLHLQLAFETARPLGKDIQDQAGTIQNPALQQRLQIAFLAGRQGVIENDQFRPAAPCRIPDFLGLAAADEQARIRCASPEDPACVAAR